jgi:hypothetical protein
MKIVLLLLPLAACGGKQAEPEAAAAPVSALSADIPTDNKSQNFANRLLDLEIRNFRPTDAGSGASLSYTSMSFSGDGTWRADGLVSIGEDSIDCVEGGDWTMEPAQTRTSASMVWNLGQTDCAGRRAGGEIRVQLTILENGRYQVRFR